ncbi:RimK family alpha-L-glutamate ligase [Thalassotalea maritima]|uniref:ATP-grasp domain-containing protein n=1 Tax=Thalassotalea maritima TaxID=3242416 RepID=UPI00352745C6
MKRCAILTMDCLDDFEVYDQLLDQPLAKLGWQTELVSWHKQDVNWDQFDVVLIRTPWDYQDDAAKFMHVLAAIENSSAVLENSINIVDWNINKKYLRELQQHGVCIVPTLWQEQYDAQLIADYFNQLDSEQIVIKPCVSANADNTFWLTRDSWAQYSQALAKAFASRDFMVQPFMQSVVDEGEFSCFYFDGHYSHSILKTPKQGDFRVQEEHGGQLRLVTAEARLKQQADHAMQQLAKVDNMPMYARVDFVRMGDEFAMMEAELIEPSLYFNMDENAAPLFARLFAERMQRLYNL